MGRNRRWCRIRCRCWPNLMGSGRKCKERTMFGSGALTIADIISPEEYARNRTDWKRKIGAIKRDRRVAVGPYVTFYFESRDTMWLQVQEMIYIEKGGLAQAPDELEAYNPLVPNGSE